MTFWIRFGIGLTVRTCVCDQTEQAPRAVGHCQLLLCSSVVFLWIDRNYFGSPKTPSWTFLLLFLQMIVIDCYILHFVMMQSFFWSMIIPVLKRLEIWEKLFPNQSFWSKTWAGSEDLIMFDMFESVQRLWPHCLGCPISPLQPQGRWVQFLETRLCCFWAEPPLLWPKGNKATNTNPSPKGTKVVPEGLLPNESLGKKRSPEAKLLCLASKASWQS